MMLNAMEKNKVGKGYKEFQPGEPGKSFAEKATFLCVCMCLNFFHEYFLIEIKNN